MGQMLLQALVRHGAGDTVEEPQSSSFLADDEEQAENAKEEVEVDKQDASHVLKSLLLGRQEPAETEERAEMGGGESVFSGQMLMDMMERYEEKEKDSRGEQAVANALPFVDEAIVAASQPQQVALSTEPPAPEEETKDPLPPPAHATKKQSESNEQQSTQGGEKSEEPKDPPAPRKESKSAPHRTERALSTDVAAKARKPPRKEHPILTFAVSSRNENSARTKLAGMFTVSNVRNVVPFAKIKEWWGVGEALSLQQLQLLEQNVFQLHVLQSRQQRKFYLQYEGPYEAGEMYYWDQTGMIDKRLPIGFGPNFKNNSVPLYLIEQSVRDEVARLQRVADLADLKPLSSGRPEDYVFVGGPRSRALSRENGPPLGRIPEEEKKPPPEALQRLLEAAAAAEEDEKAQEGRAGGEDERVISVEEVERREREGAGKGGNAAAAQAFK